jgi:hypothetical protein
MSARIQPLPESWLVDDHIVVNGRHVTAGTELSIMGERGRFRFTKYVYNSTADCEWIDVVGGMKGVKQFRSFRPDRVKTVHWKNKTRENSLTASKSVRKTV